MSRHQSIPISFAISAAVKCGRKIKNPSPACQKVVYSVDDPAARPKSSMRGQPEAQHPVEAGGDNQSDIKFIAQSMGRNPVPTFISTHVRHHSSTNASKFRLPPNDSRILHYASLALGTLMAMGMNPRN